MRGRPVLACACALALIAPATAGAQTGPDPDSPAGVEYALPLDQARRDATGRSDGSPRSRPGKPSAAAPLFGAGITPVRAGKTGSAGEENGGGRRAGAGGSRGGGEVGGGSSRPARVALGADDAGSPTLTIAGIALAVLLAGGLLGLLLRRFTRSSG